MFFRTLLIFIYLFLAFFVKPDSVLAVNNVLQSPQSGYVISVPKQEIKVTNNFEEHNIVSQNHHQTQIYSSSNKNNNSYQGFFYDILSQNLQSKFNFIKNNCSQNRMAHNISPNLKNAIYTRAP